jgi:ATP-dependent Lhr-like helicase
LLNSKPYTYLDDAPLEERRARAITLRRSLPQSGRDLGILDPDAIETVINEAQPQPRDAEEVHDALLNLVAIRPEYAPEWADWFDELAGQRRATILETVDGDRLWIAGESLPLAEKLYPGATARPEIDLPPSLRREISEEDARSAIVRGHLESLGPTTVRELMDRTALDESAVTFALAFLEAEGGSAMRGRFRVGAEDEEWCDRRLLARIHRYTLDRLRSEIEPVTAQDLVRFLLRWQHLAPGTQLSGKRGLLEAIAQVQGIDIPAVAWERHVLPARVAAYKSAWLDELCLSGDVAWARFTTRTNGDSEKAASASSATPISLVRRADLPWLSGGVRPSQSAQSLPAHPEEPKRSGGVSKDERTGNSAPALGASAEIYDLLATRGALFYDDIVAATNRLPDDVQRGLWDLVARGLATADGFQALRSLMASTKKRSFRQPRRARLFRTIANASVPSGRWSLLPQEFTHPEGLEGALVVEELAEAWAEQLLFRYGVVFRDLVKGEPFTVPWREILRALRRMEAQGSIRGGRFVTGFYGEQYARPEAVEALRAVRRAEKTGELIRVSAVDPLNLTGIITSTPRIPAIHTKSVLYRDGVPVSEDEALELVAEQRRLVAAG